MPVPSVIRQIVAATPGGAEQALRERGGADVVADRHRNSEPLLRQGTDPHLAPAEICRDPNRTRGLVHQARDGDSRGDHLGAFLSVGQLLRQTDQRVDYRLGAILGSTRA